MAKKSVELSMKIDDLLKILAVLALLKIIAPRPLFETSDTDLVLIIIFGIPILIVGTMARVFIPEIWQWMKKTLGPEIEELCSWLKKLLR